MFGNRQATAMLRRAVPWHWQIVGGVVFGVIALGAVLAASNADQSPAPLIALQMLIVIVASAGGGIFAGLATWVVAVLLHLGHASPGQALEPAAFAAFAVIVLVAAALVGVLRQDLGRIGHDLHTTQDLLAATNTRRERSKATEAMRAYYDPKTDLPTRRLVADRFGQVLPQARRTSTLAALVLLDLDRFDEVNQNFGHDTGDEVLRLVGQRLSAVMRRGDTVGRLEDSKFVVLLTALADRAGTEVAARKLQDALAEPFNVGRPARELYVSASIGIAIFPDDGEDWETLYRIAAEALRIGRLGR